MADGRRFEKPLNRYNSPMVRRIAMRFGTIMHFAFLSLAMDKNLEDGRHIGKSQNRHIWATVA